MGIKLRIESKPEQPKSEMKTLNRKDQIIRTRRKKMRILTIDHEATPC